MLANVLRRRIKIGIHLAGVALALGIAAYLGFIAPGLTERVAAAVGAVVGLMSTVGQAFPVIDKAVDSAIPDDAAPSWILVLFALGSSGALFFSQVRDARADENGSWKYGPSVAAAVAAVDLGNGNYLVGANAIPLGACLGATYTPVALGVDVCANVQISNSESNRYFPSLMVHWRDWVNVGAGLMVRQKSSGDGVYGRWLLLLGGRLGLLGG
jgi:hypothetical protein